MITYADKGAGLHIAMRAAGHDLVEHNGVWISDNDVVVQAIIDGYDPLPYEVKSAKDDIKVVAFTKREEYVTVAPGKDAEYRQKQAEGKEYLADSSIGPYLQARITRTSETPAEVVTIWIAESNAMRSLLSEVSAIVDHASLLLDVETDWTQCRGIADQAIGYIGGL